MRVFKGLNKAGRFKKPVIALGVFDGVHRGHINILKDASRRAHSIGGTSIALTFDPHPQKEESLSSLEHRLRLIAQQGIDVCVVINFNRNFQKMSAEDFIKNILSGKLQAFYIYVGRNFRFGRRAEGSVATLKRFSKILHFKLKIFKVIKTNHQPISSTYIRALIKKGKLFAAKKLLCRPVTVLGSVRMGLKIGSRLGFPTANIDPHHEVMPPPGVYVVRIIFGSRRYNGICNIGTRPTITKKRKIQIEVHIFNFHKNIYAKFLEIEFIKKIREEIKFPNSCALTEQIRKDVTFAKALFSRH